MNQILLYCRQGFEKECAGEIQDKATEVEVYGFPRVEKTPATCCLSVTSKAMQKSCFRSCH